MNENKILGMSFKYDIGMGKLLESFAMSLNSLAKFEKHSELQRKMVESISFSMANQLNFTEVLNLPNNLFESIRISGLALSSSIQKVASEMKNINAFSESLGLMSGVSQVYEMQKKFMSTAFNIDYHSKDIKGLEDQIASSLGLALGPISHFNETYFKSMEQLSKSLLNITKNFNQYDFDVSPSGTVCISDMHIDIGEIQECIESHLEEINSSIQQLTIEKRLYKILERFANEHPIIKFFVMGIVLQLLLSYVGNILFTNNSAKNIFEFKQNKVIIVKNINMVIQNFRPDHNFYRKYRFVKTKYLDVRQCNSMKNTIVDRIYFGQIVEIIYKNKNWTKIECVNNNGEVVTSGWVLTRYLSRFKEK